MDRVTARFNRKVQHFARKVLPLCLSPGLLLLRFFFELIKSAETNYARFIPEYSNTYPNPDPVLWVGYYQTNNGSKFREIVKDFMDEVAKAEGAPRGYWYSVMGGSKDTPDFFVATPFSRHFCIQV
ncbi:MAG: hypothetical protein ACOCYD_01130 [bacterium]